MMRRHPVGQRHITSPIEEALRNRATARGRISPGQLPPGFPSWVAHLAWLELRRDEAAKAVCACENRTFLVAKCGHLFTCGPDHCGDSKHTQIHKGTFAVPSPVPCIATIRISHVSAGSTFTAAVSIAGALYTWGFCMHGGLGHGDTSPSRIPRQVQAFAHHPILSVAAGWDSCVAVTETSEAFSWGCDVVSGNPQLLPRAIHSLRHTQVRSAALGRRRILFVTETGTLGCIGPPRQLKYPFAQQKQHYADIAHSLRHVRIVAAAACTSASLAMAHDGTVFAWREQQWYEHSSLPTKVHALHGLGVSSIAMSNGANFALTHTGELYAWGHKHDGRLGVLKQGHGDLVSRVVPTKVGGQLTGHSVVYVSSGMAHTLAVTKQGGIFGWGTADYLGISGDDTHPLGPYILSPVQYPHTMCEPTSR
jgi:alpha-tubulin suppressor-like RCC1 family protein